MNVKLAWEYSLLSSSSTVFNRVELDLSFYYIENKITLLHCNSLSFVSNTIILMK